jgi:hypothetical protein
MPRARMPANFAPRQHERRVCVPPKVRHATSPARSAGACGTGAHSDPVIYAGRAGAGDDGVAAEAHMDRGDYGMSDGEDWGPWIEHDGKGWPSRGLFAEKEYADGLVLCGIIGARPFTHEELGAPRYTGKTFRTSWVWDAPGPCVPVIRYRIRRPRALREMIDRAASLDTTAPVKVGVRA